MMRCYSMGIARRPADIMEEVWLSCGLCRDLEPLNESFTDYRDRV